MPATAYARYTNNTTDNPSPPRIPRYIAQEAGGTVFNLLHLRFTARNSEWIFNEMQRTSSSTPNTIGCSSECLSPTDLKITGPSTLCGTATYSTPLRGTGVTFTWTARPASAFSNPNGVGSTFTTSSIGNGSGIVTLVVGGDCPLTLTKAVKVGAPDMPGMQQLEPLDGCTYLAATFQITDFNPSLAYTFTTRQAACAA